MTLAWFIYTSLFLQPGESVRMPLALPNSFLMAVAAPPNYTQDPPALRLVVACGQRYEALTGLTREQMVLTAARWYQECQS